MKKINFFIYVFFIIISSISINAIQIQYWDNSIASQNQFGYVGTDLRKSCTVFTNATSYQLKNYSMKIDGITSANDLFYFDIRYNSVLNTPIYSATYPTNTINASSVNYFKINSSVVFTASKDYLLCWECVGCTTSEYFEFTDNQNTKFNGMNWAYFYLGGWNNITGRLYLTLNVDIPSSGGVQPSLSILSGMKNGTVTNSTNFNFYFNQTSINNSNDYFCGVYDNTTLKNSINTTITGNKNLSFSLLGNYEKYFNFTINCYNENASNNISALYYVDNIKSVLNYAFPNGTYYNNDVLYTNFSISDTNLYSFEWLVYQGITLKENITHTGNIGGTYNVYNLSSVSQIVGSYNWVLNVWENHNPLTSADLFKEYTVLKNVSDLTFKDNKVSYTITSKENLEVNTETKDLKQYFTYTPITKDTPKFYTYYVKYDGTLEYIKDSQYKGHFVLWDIKRYIDFQCNDDVKVFKENDNLYRIETPCTKFETTGNLNYMQFTGNFSIITPPSLSDEYLLSINETITTQTNIINLSVNNIYEVFKMLGVILIFLTALTLGIKFANVILLYLASSFGVLIGFTFIQINDLLYNGFGLILIIICVIIAINVYSFQKQKKEQELY